jgi:hypothetical protein
MNGHGLSFKEHSSLRKYIIQSDKSADLDTPSINVLNISEILISIFFKERLFTAFPPELRTNRRLRKVFKVHQFSITEPYFFETISSHLETISSPLDSSHSLMEIDPS